MDPPDESGWAESTGTGNRSDSGDDDDDTLCKEPPDTPGNEQTAPEEAESRADMLVENHLDAGAVVRQDSPRGALALTGSRVPQITGVVNIAGKMDVKIKFVQKLRVTNSSTLIVEGDYHDHIHVAGYSELRDHSEAAISRDADIFVNTEAYKKAEKQLEENPVLVITGPPGSGKSALAHALLRRYHANEYTPLVVREYKDWRHTVGNDQKQIVLLEHVIGTDRADQNQLHKWSDTFRSLKAVCTNRACLVVITMNDSVFSDTGVNTTLDKTEFSRIDMRTFPLQNGEKREILENHLKKTGKEITERDFQAILEKEDSGPLFGSHCKQFAESTEAPPERFGQGDVACGCVPIINITLSNRFQQNLTSKTERSSKTLKNSGNLYPGIIVTRFHNQLSNCDDFWEPHHMLVGCEDLPEFHKACRSAEFGGVVLVLLQTGQNPNAMNSVRQSGLHIASYHGHADLVSILIMYGCQVNDGDMFGWTPLHLACFQGHSDLAGILLDNGANLEATTQQKLTPLHLACKYGHVNIARKLLEKRPLVDPVNVLENTPLHAACHGGHVEIVRLLLDFNADKTAKDSLGWTPLHFACQEGHTPIVNDLLLRNVQQTVTSPHGSEPFQRLDCQHGHSDLVKSLRHCTVRAKQTQGTIAVCHSCYVKHEKAIKNINIHSDFVNAPSFLAGVTCLHLAVQNGHNEITRRLLEAGACAEIRERSEGMTPLHIACVHNHPEIVNLLLHYKSTMDAISKHVEYTPLQCACHNGHDGPAKVLLEKGADASIFNVSNDIPLHTACRLGWRAVVDLLLSTGKQDVNVRNMQGYTPLLLACRHNEAQVVKILLEGGASPDVKGKCGITHMEAIVDIKFQRKICENGVAFRVEMLSRECIPELKPITIDTLPDTCSSVNETIENLFNFRGTRSNLPLRYAVLCSANDCPEWLLRLLVGGPEKSPLMVAACNGNAEIINLLFDHNARMDIDALCAACRIGHRAVVDTFISHMEDRDVQENGTTLLHCACSNNQLCLLRMVLQAGVSANTKDEAGTTPLHAACRAGNVEIIQELLQNGARVNEIDAGEWTPLHIACLEGRKEIVNILLLHTAYTDIKTGQGLTPLHLACTHCHLATVETLLNIGVDLEAEDTDGRTPLLACIDNRSVRRDPNSSPPSACLETHPADDTNSVLRDPKPVVRELLQRAANINTHDHRKVTPLHLSCSSGDEELCQLLLHHGADVSSADTEGSTPLHEACLKANVDTVTLLLQYGANLDARNLMGDTPLHHACRKEDVKLVSFLLRYGACGNVENNHGLTPLSLVQDEDIARTIHLMIEKYRAENTAEKVCEEVAACSEHSFTPDTRAEVQLSSENEPERSIEVSNLKINVQAESSENNNLSLTKDDAIRNPSLSTGTSRTDHINAVITPLVNNIPPVITDNDGNDGRQQDSTDDVRHRRNIACNLHPNAGDASAVSTVLTTANNESQKALNVRIQMLLEACRQGDTSTVKTLLHQDKALLVNTASSTGATPLHLACSGGHTVTVAYLLRHGADVHACDLSVQTPLHYASAQGQVSAIAILLAHGAGIEDADCVGNTALHLASYSGHLNAACVLLNQGANARKKNNRDETALQVAFKTHATLAQVLNQYASAVAVDENNSFLGQVFVVLLLALAVCACFLSLLKSV